MKRILLILSISCSISFGQPLDPPHGEGHNGEGNGHGHAEHGNGHGYGHTEHAGIDDGLYLLLGLGIAYGIKKLSDNQFKINKQWKRNK